MASTQDLAKEWRADASINKHDLDSEVEHMPALYEKWALLEARYIREEDQAEHIVGVMEELLKEAKARADLELRSWSIPMINKEFGLQLDPTRDLTEPAYKSLTMLHPKVQSAKDELDIARQNFIEVKHKRMIFKHARESMRIKHDSLDRLGRLHDQGWWIRDFQKSSGRRHEAAKAAYKQGVKREKG